jgi:zinc and cadmium transporter
MDSFFPVLFFSVAGGLLSLLGGVLILSREKWANDLAKYFMPFAAGGLLAAVFLDLLPEGLEEAQANLVLSATLAGIMIFFLAERFLRWFHHHHEYEDEKKDPSIPLIVTGDTLHNALDGVAIASAFLINVPTGIITTLVVALHEIPQEIGDFSLLLSKGMRRKKVLMVNIMSSLATVAAALITFALGSGDKIPAGLLLGLSAGFLLYIALSDIIPTIHAGSGDEKLIQAQPMIFIVGLVVVGFSIQFAHRFLEEPVDATYPEVCLKQPDHHAEIEAYNRWCSLGDESHTH